MWPHRQQPPRLCRPWDSPDKNTGVGCHFLLQCVKVKSESEVAQSCQTLRNPMDCSLPGSSVHGIFQARVLEWGAIAFSDWRTNDTKELLTLLFRFWIPCHASQHQDLTKGLRVPRESGLEGQWGLIMGLPEDWGKQRLQYWRAQTKFCTH